MTTPDEMRRTMLLYLERVGQHDVDSILRMFSEDISVEDPVGGPPGTRVVGRKAVAAFFREGFSRSRPSPRLSGPICTTRGGAAAMPFVLRLEFSGRVSEIDVIDIMTFANSGSITSLRAFWDPKAARIVDARPR